MNFSTGCEVVNALKTSTTSRSSENCAKQWKYLKLIYDKDDTDTLDRKQFESLVKSLGYRKVNSKKLFKELDVDHDGKLSFYEFMKWLNWVPIEDF